MSKTVIFIVVALIVLAGAIFFVVNSGSNSESSSSNVNQVQKSSVSDNEENGVEDFDESLNFLTHTVEISNSGFTPKVLTINKGDSVKFVNTISRETWPASAIHPTHKVYPGSDIHKCGTSEENEIFDACHSLVQEESYSFTFNEVGTWNYHDHLSPGTTGTIIVN